MAKRKTSGWVWYVFVFAVLMTTGDLAGLLLPAWRASEADKVELDIAGRTMGTTYSAKAWYAEATITKEQIEERLTEINQQMSTYQADSELSRFNVSESTEWFAVSEQTAFVVEKALHFHELTDGASDVTVGPLVRLWDFGPGRHAIGSQLGTPAEEVLTAAQKNSGAEKLAVRTVPPALRKSTAAVEVDLSSIAKGYAVDAIVDLLDEHKFLNFMVEIGGEGQRQRDSPRRCGMADRCRGARFITAKDPLHHRSRQQSTRDFWRLPQFPRV